MPLIPYPDPLQLSAEAQERLRQTPQNIARMLAGTGTLFMPLLSVSKAFFTNGALPPALRELITLRIGHRLGGEYELDQHGHMARSIGVTEHQMDAIAGSLPSDQFSDAENAALLLVDSLIDNVRAPEELVLRAYEQLGEAAFHQLFVVSGYYQMMARYTETLRVELDGGTKGNPLEKILAMR